MTGEEHNKYISWVFLAHAGFQLLMLLLMAAFFLSIIFSIPTRPGEPGPPRAIFGVMIAFITVIQLVFTTPSIVASYALRNKKPWARIAAIVAAVTSAMHIPFGTAACVYSMWFFMGDAWKGVYPGQAGGRSTPQELPQYDPAKWEGSFKTDDQGRAVFTKAEPPDWRS